MDTSDSWFRLDDRHGPDLGEIAEADRRVVDPPMQSRRLCSQRPVRLTGG
jgi:hypothetical protein